MPEVDPSRKKNIQELIDRMSKGFDENLLDPLVDSIVNEPDKPLPSESEVKAKQIKYQVIEVAPTEQGEDLASFFGAKIGESFSMAAKARRADKGLEKKPTFYLGKALTNQFGGDLVNRTKGYFSASPDDTQDPALNRSQRFTASVQPFMNEQGPLSPPVQGPERSGIAGAFDKVAARIDELINLKRNKSKQSQVANEIQQIEVKEATEEVKESNDLKKKSTEIQKDFIAFSKDQESDSEILEIENTSEERVPMSDTEIVDNSRPDEPEEKEDQEQPSLLDNALDFFTGSDIAADIGERVTGRVGRRGAGRAVTRTAIKLGGKKLAKTAAVKVTQSFIRKAALGLMRPLIKRIPIVGGLIDFVVSLMLGEPLGRAAAKAVGATLGGALGTLIPIPFAGTILGGFLGDMVGGAIYDAATGGSGSVPKASPEVTQKVAGEELNPDNPTEMQQKAMDMSADMGNTPPDPPEKLASGGVMAGEAGPESVFSLSSTQGRKVVDEVSSVENTGLSALPFILGVTSQVTSLLSGPVKPFIQQKVGTLERLFGLAKFNITKLVGDGMDSVKSVGQNLNIQIPGTNTGGDDGVESAETIGGSPIAAVNVPPGDVKERAKAAFQFYKSKGFSDSGAAYMVGNLMQESTLDPAANGDNGHAWGLAQWRDDAASGARWIKYKEWAAANNKQPGDFYAQLEYTVVEGAGYGIERMKGNDIEKHKQFVKAYEGYSDVGSRFGYAQDIINNIQEYKGAVAPVETPPPPAPSATQVPEGHMGPVMPQEPPSSPVPLDSVDASSTPNAPVQPAITAPMPVHLQESDKKSHITVQPIIYEGSSTPIGYQKNIDTGGGQMARFFYDKTGEKTTLVDIKRERLQQN